MAQNIKDEINRFHSFQFDDTLNSIINLKKGFETDIDEFLAIQHILDNNHIAHKFEKNFNITILR